MLTEAQIRRRVGTLEDWQSAEIIKTGAGERDLHEAALWIEAQGDITAERAKGLSPMAQDIVDILAADEPPDPDEG